MRGSVIIIAKNIKCTIIFLYLMSSNNNILYYSNYCKHCQKIYNLLLKANLMNDITCLCIDKRGRDPQTNQPMIILDNGTRMLLPPNVHSVPALLLRQEQHRVIYGDDIIKYYEPKIVNEKMVATDFNGEPKGFNLGGNTMFSGGMSSDLNSFSSSYDGRLKMKVENDDFVSNKIKMGDDSAYQNYEQQRQQMDKQLGIGQMPGRMQI